MAKKRTLEDIMAEEDALFAKNGESTDVYQQNSAPQVPAARIRNKNMTAEDILNEEDQHFNGNMINEGIDENADMRKELISGLLNIEAESTTQMRTKAGVKINTQTLILDIKGIIKKHGLDPNGGAEAQVIATFIKNLSSVGLASYIIPSGKD